MESVGVPTTSGNQGKMIFGVSCWGAFSAVMTRTVNRVRSPKESRFGVVCQNHRHGTDGRGTSFRIV